ncbi:MAG: hypothetical protein AAGF20_05920 [Pseudomonadota bacterium]
MAATLSTPRALQDHKSWVQTLYTIWSEAGLVAQQLSYSIENEDEADWVMEKQLETASRVATVEATSLADIALKLRLWAKANLPEHDEDNPYNSIIISALADLQRFCASQIGDHSDKCGCVSE